MFDLFMMLAGCFGKWVRVQALMIFIMAWCVIILGISGWLSVSSAGDIGNLTFASKDSYSNWNSDVCKTSPYMYMQPFAFTFSSVNVTSSSTTLTSCPWPETNSILRFVVAAIAFVVIILLFFKTLVSVLARPIWVTFALLFFAIFVLDANAAIMGNGACTSGFSNTPLGNDLYSAGVTLSCATSDYAGLVVIDLILSGLFFLLHSAWALCTDLYVSH